MSEKSEYIKNRFNHEGISLTEKQAAQFETYYEMLIETNKVMNLTAITDFVDVVEKHFLDSGMITKYFDFSSVSNFIDVGTGAGFPGIPLKILYPQVKATLLDSLNKRMVYLQNVVDKLELNHVELIHGRAEDFGKDKAYREKYDLCVSRAVANLSTLSEYCTPFVKVGGYFISYKSGNVDEELETAKAAIKLLGCKTRKVDKFFLQSETDGQGRSFILIERLNVLDKKYPRKAGMPSKMPLK